MEKNRKLQIGVIGLGTMGSAIVETLVRNEFVVTAFEPVSPKILLPSSPPRSGGALTPTPLYGHST